MVPKTIDRRTAISGLMPARQFRILERVLRADSERVGRLGHGQTERLKTELSEDLTGMGRIVHCHRDTSAIILIIDIDNIAA